MGANEQLRNIARSPSKHKAEAVLRGVEARAQGAIANGGTYKMSHYGVVSGSTTPGAPAGQPLCLDVDNNLATVGTSIGQWVGNGNDAQRFIFELQSDGSYKLRHKGTVMYVQPIGLSKTANTQIQQNVLLTTDDAQRWFITDPNSNERYKFTLWWPCRKSRWQPACICCACARAGSFSKPAWCSNKLLHAPFGLVPSKRRLT